MNERTPGRSGDAPSPPSADLDAEFDAYIDLRARELIRQGLSEPEAWRRAREAFGDVHKIRQQCREVARRDHRRRQWEEWMGTLPSDLRFAFRSLARRPLLAMVAVGTLALGIGANAAVFSVLHGVLLAPLPYPDPDRLVRLFETRPGVPQFPVAPGNYLDYRDSGVLQNVAIYYRSDLQLSDPDRPTRLVAMRVSAGFFETLGVEPLLGRGFTPSDEQAAEQPVVVLSHHVWRDLFDADDSLVGRGIRLSGREFTVVGVMPPGMTHVGGSYRTVGYGEPVDVWWPEPLIAGEARRFAHYTNGIARLRDGVSLEESAARMDAVSERLQQQYPDSNQLWTTRLIPLREEIVGASRTMLWTLLGAVGFVLLIACVNVANFMLARATSRREEIAVRTALGAKRWRIMRQLMIEALLLAGGGGLAGIVVGGVGVRALVALGPEGMPRLHEIGLSLPVLTFALAVSLATGLLFGVVPAIRASGGDLVSPLRGEGRGSGDRSAVGPRRLLVVVETALASMLLIAAGLMFRSFSTIVAVEPGFDPEGVVAASVSLPGADYPGAGARAALHAQLREGLLATPGIVAAGLGSDLPWSGYDENTGFGIVGWTPPEDVRTSARYHFRGPGYYETLGTGVLAGREFADSDTADADLVVLINDAAARRFWRSPGGAGEPIGATVDLWGAERRVVGVVADITDDPTRPDASPAIYFPVAQMGNDPMHVVVRSSLPAAATVAVIREQMHRLDPTVPLAEVRTLSQVAARATTTQRFLLTLVAIFAAVALSLAAVGVYGVLAFAVMQRTREIGIRMALGAGTRGVRIMVIRQGLALIVAGLVLGSAGAAALSGILTGLLFGVSPLDPWSFASSALVLLAIGAAAAFIPATQAARLHPVEALRQ